MERRVNLNVELLEQEWLRELFRSFCRWPGINIASPLLISRIDAYSRFFVELDRNFHASSEINPLRLVDVFGQETLRRHHVPVSFLTQAFDMAPAEQALEDSVERKRVEQIRTNAVGAAWKNDLLEYEASLRSGNRSPPLAERTIRLYLNAASQLLASSDGKSASNIIDADVKRVLRKKKGLAASLTSFVGFLREKFGTELGSPVVRKKLPAQREKKMLDEVRASSRVLRRTKNFREARAHVAILMSRLLGVSLKMVLRLKKNDVEIQDDRLILLVTGGAREPIARGKTIGEAATGTEVMELAVENVRGGGNIATSGQAEISGEAFELVRPWLERMIQGGVESEKTTAHAAEDWRRGAVGEDTLKVYLFRGRGYNRAMKADSVRYWG